MLRRLLRFSRFAFWMFTQIRQGKRQCKEILSFNVKKTSAFFASLLAFFAVSFEPFHTKIAEINHDKLFCFFCYLLAFFAVKVSLTNKISIFTANVRMALHVKTLGIRSLTALVFVIVLIGSITWNYLSFTLLFYFIAVTTLTEFFAIAERSGAGAYKRAGYLCGTTVFFSFLKVQLFQPFAFSTLDLRPVAVITPFIIMTVALFSKNEHRVRNTLVTIAGIIYCVFPFSLLHEYVCAGANGVYSPEILLGVIFLIWSNDTFAYLGGSIYGKRKIAPLISPGKTWEGTITGVICTFLISFLIRDFILEESGPKWQILGIVVPVIATIGDLFESQLKRAAQMKDSGNLMPGHGGVLDRFDSLIFVAPFALVILKFL